MIYARGRARCPIPVGTSPRRIALAFCPSPNLTIPLAKNNRHFGRSWHAEAKLKTGWRVQWLNRGLAIALLLATPFAADAGKSYSSGGGRSYSSSSSRSSSFSSSRSSGGSSSRSSSGSSKSFSSGSGKSYSSGSTWTGTSKSYSSGKSYTGSSGSKYTSSSSSRNDSSVSKSSRTSSGSGSSGFNFDTAASRARKEETSKSDFTKFKDSQNPRPVQRDDSYRGPAPPVITPSSRTYRRTVYVPDTVVIQTRPTRIWNVFQPYWYRPVVVYHDPYGSFFWWWLLDRSIEDQAWWAYHHRYDMDPARYQALRANNQQLENRVAQLEAQQSVQRDSTYTPTNLDRDLMYSDQYVNQSYNNRATTGGRVAFGVLAVPIAIACCGFFIWLIWFKRW